MARHTTPLTATQIKNAKPRDRDYKLFDGGGLFLLVTKRNSKLWRLKYNFDRKEKLLSLGAYPSIDLAEARALRLTHKSTIAKGLNPSEIKKEAKVIQYQPTYTKLNALLCGCGVFKAITQLGNIFL